MTLALTWTWLALLVLLCCALAAELHDGAALPEWMPVDSTPDDWGVYLGVPAFTLPDVAPQGVMMHGYCPQTGLPVDECDECMEHGAQPLFGSPLSVLETGTEYPADARLTESRCDWVERLEALRTDCRMLAMERGHSGLARAWRTLSVGWCTVENEVRTDDELTSIEARMSAYLATATDADRASLSLD